MFSERKVAIMLINWNGSQDTLECLHSLENIKYPRDRISIWIADNNSDDDSLNYLCPQVAKMQAGAWQSINLLKLDKNYGSPGAFNRIYSHIPQDTDILIRLDNDVIIDPKSVFQVCQRFNQFPDMAILGVQSFLYNSPTVKCSGAWYVNWSLNTQYVTRPEKMMESDSIVGNFMAIRNSTIQQLKYLFDERLFITFDDCELCLRINKYLNQKIFFDPDIICYHKSQSSTSKVKDFVSYCFHRNSILIFKQYAPRDIRLLLGMLVTLLRLIKAMLLADKFKLYGYLDGILSRCNNDYQWQKIVDKKWT
jgi:GT2 family glycosyltransferase